MTQQLSPNRKKYRLLRNFAIIVLKLIVCTGLWYSFDVFSSTYERFEVLRRMVYAIYSFWAANIFIAVVSNLVIIVYLRRIRDREEVRGSFVLGINRISTVLNTVFAVIALMLVFGINPKEFITSITIVAMAIALLFRDYITNMISGLLIMFSDQLTIGDYIKLTDHEGKVMDITLANIVLKNDEDDVVLVPNNLFFTSSMVNRSAPSSRKVSLDFELPVNAAGNLSLLEARLKKLLADQPEIVNQQSLRLQILSLQKDWIRYKVQFTLNKKNKQQQIQLKRAVYDEVLRFYIPKEKSVS